MSPANDVSGGGNGKGERKKGTSRSWSFCRPGERYRVSERMGVLNLDREPSYIAGTFSSWI